MRMFSRLTVFFCLILTGFLLVGCSTDDDKAGEKNVIDLTRIDPSGEESYIKDVISVDFEPIVHTTVGSSIPVRVQVSMTKPEYFDERLNSSGLVEDSFQMQWSMNTTTPSTISGSMPIRTVALTEAGFTVDTPDTFVCENSGTGGIEFVADITYTVARVEKHGFLNLNTDTLEKHYTEQIRVPSTAFLCLSPVDEDFDGDDSRDPHEDQEERSDDSHDIDALFEGFLSSLESIVMPTAETDCEDCQDLLLSYKAAVEEIDTYQSESSLREQFENWASDYSDSLDEVALLQRVLDDTKADESLKSIRELSIQKAQSELDAARSQLENDRKDLDDALSTLAKNIEDELIDMEGRAFGILSQLQICNENECRLADVDGTFQRIGDDDVFEEFDPLKNPGTGLDLSHDEDTPLLDPPQMLECEIVKSRPVCK